MQASHRRFNPLLGQWVLCSPGRLGRPWLGDEREPPKSFPPAYDPECYMCPGNRRAGGERNPEYEGVFVFDNDFPALSPSASGDMGCPHPLLLSRAERGRCRVLCFSPRHDDDLGSMSPRALRAVVEAWAEQTAILLAQGLSYVQLFENRGSMMGASNAHPHGQIWAVESVPSIPSLMARRFDDYWSANGSDLLEDYLEEECRRGERIVETAEHWLQLVPFWAVWPFETMLVPRRRVGALTELDEAERTELSVLLGRLTRRYDGLFETPFPYSMAWYQKPADGDAHPGFRLHAAYLPPLLRSASVRKFLVGYELAAEPQRDFVPEEAAARLRSVEP